MKKSPATYITYFHGDCLSSSNNAGKFSIIKCDLDDLTYKRVHVVCENGNFGAFPDDKSHPLSCRRRQRQALLQWAYSPFI